MQTKLLGGVGTALIAILIGATSGAEATSERTAAAEPAVIESATALESPAVRDLEAPPASPARRRLGSTRWPALPVAAIAAPPRPPRPRTRWPALRAPAAGPRCPTSSSTGSANPFSCGGCLPPDTIGDAGPSHYIQMTNATKVAIYNKSGVLQTPMFDLASCGRSARTATSTIAAIPWSSTTVSPIAGCSPSSRTRPGTASASRSRRPPTHTAPITSTSSPHRSSPTTSRSASGRPATTSPRTRPPTRPTRSTARRCSPATRRRFVSASAARPTSCSPPTSTARPRRPTRAGSSTPSRTTASTAAPTGSSSSG